MHIAKMQFFPLHMLDLSTHNPPAGMKTMEVEILHIWRVSFLGKTYIEHKQGDI